MANLHTLVCVIYIRLFLAEANLNIGESRLLVTANFFYSISAMIRHLHVSCTKQTVSERRNDDNRHSLSPTSLYGVLAMEKFWLDSGAFIHTYFSTFAVCERMNLSPCRYIIHTYDSLAFSPDQFLSRQP